MCSVWRRCSFRESSSASLLLPTLIRFSPQIGASGRCRRRPSLRGRRSYVSVLPATPPQRPICGERRTESRSRQERSSLCQLCICPANWRLPLSGGSDTETGSFPNLLRQYSLASTPTSGNNNIATSPLYFVRSGYVDPGSSLRRAGDYGYYWSGRAISSSNAYNPYFSSWNVLPPSSRNRYLGSSVRCVAGWE